ncbi:NAD(P)H-dependent oxidoreductase subunit E [Candidatus Solincola tengchongensis]|uniref:NADH-quinone oxidoreductase subunit NuoE family protein n=1 Tax=Candidatus Solincola tengchongensis TaxID=2900693 RepID=UPI00257A3F7C|nr:NAD(P)H-dependent oxidoreductase subunit E [Candidatus Solincola tengchongensis]
MTGENRLETVISGYDRPYGRLLGILEAVQEEEGYLRRETLELLAERLGVPLSRLYSLATFYSLFELQPVGRHVITVCRGTACHVRGADRLLAALRDLLGLEPGETTPDGKFTLTTDDLSFSVKAARCFGACSMAPVVRVDGRAYGLMTPERIPALLERYGWRR